MKKRFFIDYGKFKRKYGKKTKIKKREKDAQYEQSYNHLALDT